MKEPEALGTEQIKKNYINNGAHNPLFGVTIEKIKPVAQKIKKNRPLADQLYASGNYDAMYFYMLSNYLVAVTLEETDLAQVVADK